MAAPKVISITQPWLSNIHSPETVADIRRPGLCYSAPIKDVKLPLVPNN
jgi:hypothetical protein